MYREYGGTSAVLRFVGTWLLLVTGGGPTPDKPDVMFAPPVDPSIVSHEMTIRVPDCRASRLLVSAADDLLSQAGARPLPVAPERLAVVVGTALGGVEEGERALAGEVGRLPRALYDAPAHALKRWLGARGPAITVATACASGATAMGLGAELLRRGEADMVVAGGYDGLCRFVLRGFNGLLKPAWTRLTWIS